MKIEISEKNYEAIGRIIKRLPSELSCNETTSGKSVSMDCREGTLCHFSNEHGDVALAIAQLSMLMREVWYNSEINRLQEERDGLTQ
jgi:hypothetical protein